MPADDHKVQHMPGVANETKLTPIEEIKTAFNIGTKMTVTPRGGEPTELHIRQFYSDQLFEVVDQVEKVWNIAKALADPNTGNLDLFELFRQCKEEVLLLIAKGIEQDRTTFVGKLEVDDLMSVFEALFNANKDFFEQRVKGKLTNLMMLISSIS
jgi:hypothetical protein